MLSISQIKKFKSLHKKKIRRIEKKILLEGYRLIQQAISKNIQLDEIWLTKKSENSSLGQKLITKIKTLNIPYSIISNKIIRQISDSLNDQGVIALTSIPKYKQYQKTPKYSLYLDGISDPGNMGTILRTAAWFGIKSIFKSPNCVDPFNSKVIRSAMGAHFYFLHFETINFEKLSLDLIKSNIQILGSDVKGESIELLDFSTYTGWCLILGNESHGISPPLQNSISKMVSIPGVTNIESLNVSVANGILLHKLTQKKPVTN